MRAIRFKPVPNLLGPDPRAETIDGRELDVLFGLAAALFFCCLFMAFAAWRYASSKTPHRAAPPRMEPPVLPQLAPEHLPPLRAEPPRPAPDALVDDPVGNWRLRSDAHSPKPAPSPVPRKAAGRAGLGAGGAAAPMELREATPLQPRPGFEAIPNFVSATDFTGSQFQPFKRRGQASDAPSVEMLREPGAAGLATAAEGGGPGSARRAGGTPTAQALRALGMADAVQARLNSAVAQGLLAPEQSQFLSAQEASLSAIEHADQVTRQAAKANPDLPDAQLAAQYMDKAVELANAGDFRSANAYARSAKLLLESAAAQRAARDQQ